MRADSGFYAHAVVAVCRRLDIRFSITIRQHTGVRRLIEAIPEGAWTPIHFGAFSAHVTRAEGPGVSTLAVEVRRSSTGGLDFSPVTGENRTGTVDVGGTLGGRQPPSPNRHGRRQTR